MTSSKEFMNKFIQLFVADWKFLHFPTRNSFVASQLLRFEIEILKRLFLSLSLLLSVSYSHLFCVGDFWLGKLIRQAHLFPTLFQQCSHCSMLIILVLLFILFRSAILLWSTKSFFVLTKRCSPKGIAGRRSVGPCCNC